MNKILGMSLLLTLFSTQLLANDEDYDITTGSDVDILDGAPGNYRGELPQVTEPKTTIEVAPDTEDEEQISEEE